jgi:hypothetical protein
MHKNKTVKKTPLPPLQPLQPLPLPQQQLPGLSMTRGSVETMSDYVSDAQMYQESQETPTVHRDPDEDRQQRINELIQTMHQRQVDNDGQRLADFKPLSHPIVRTKKPDDGAPPADAPTYLPNPVFGHDPPFAQQQQRGQQGPSAPSWAPAGADSDQTANQNYYSVYRAPPTITQAPYYVQRGSSGAGSMGAAPPADQKWSDKMNYIIHLLEEQTNEKSNTSTEEFVMFAMVGVFIIYVLDSFSRHGRYVR